MSEVHPLGRGTVLTTAQEQELQANRAYTAALVAAGPVNNDAAALAHRNAALAYARELDTLRVLGRRDREQNLRNVFTEYGYSVTF